MRLVAGYADIDDVDGFVARLDAIGDEHGCAVAGFDARYVAGRRHLVAAVERANRAFARDDAIADDRGIEILLYAAGRRQIRRALEMGVSEGCGPIVVVVDAAVEVTDPATAEADVAAAIEALVEPAEVIGHARDDGRLREFFDITDAEVAATDASLELLVIERVAMLVVEK